MIIKKLYPAIEVVRKEPANYENMYVGKEEFIKTKEKFVAINLWKEENAFVSPFGVVFNNLRVIKETVYGMFNPAIYRKTFWKKRVLGKVDTINDICILAHNSYYQNYYHFLLEIMPRIYLTQKETKADALIINEDQNKFVKEYISLFDFKSVYTIKNDRIAKVKEVYFISQIARPLAYHPELLKEFAAWIRLKLLDTQSILPSPTRIFISRKNAAYRISHNEEKIQLYLEENGFITLTPENYSVKEQANMFKNAEIIIGSHGAGLSNFIYAEKCRLIVDIIHQEHPQDCFYNAAAIFNIDYYYFQCAGAEVRSYKNNDDVIIDVERFKKEISPFFN